MNMVPQIEGTFSIHASRSRFIEVLRQRVGNGLLTGQAGPRSNYSIVESGPESIRVRANGWWTAINVGLNDLNLKFSDSGKLHYCLQYWRWAIYCIVLCFGLGLAGVVLLVTFDIRNYIAAHPGSRIPGLSIEQNLYFAWGNLVFWGFIWPWIMIALHKRPLRRLLKKLVTEIDNEATIESCAATNVGHHSHAP